MLPVVISHRWLRCGSLTKFVMTLLLVMRRYIANIDVSAWHRYRTVSYRTPRYRFFDVLSCPFFSSKNGVGLSQSTGFVVVLSISSRLCIQYLITKQLYVCDSSQIICTSLPAKSDIAYWNSLTWIKTTKVDTVDFCTFITENL